MESWILKQSKGESHAAKEIQTVKKLKLSHKRKARKMTNEKRNRKTKGSKEAIDEISV